MTHRNTTSHRNCIEIFMVQQSKLVNFKLSQKTSSTKEIPWFGSNLTLQPYLLLKLLPHPLYWPYILLFGNIELAVIELLSQYCLLFSKCETLHHTTVTLHSLFILLGMPWYLLSTLSTPTAPSKNWSIIFSFIKSSLIHLLRSYFC